jgi:curli production assembly/transport component CsgG
VEYRLDSVTVDLRIVSVRDGRVYAAVTADKVIYSVLTQGGVFRIVGTNNLLELEAGFSRNEPAQLAVRQAIQKAVYGMIFEGALQGLWSFENPARGTPALEHYLLERDGLIDAMLIAEVAPPPPVAPTPATPEALQGERMLLRELPPTPQREPMEGSGDYPPLPSGAGGRERQFLLSR